MHSISRQYTYNRSLYARRREGRPSGCRTLYASDRLVITDDDAGARGESCSFDGVSAGPRLLVTRRGAALVRRRTELGRGLAAEPLQAIVLEPGEAYVVQPVDAGHSFTVFSFDSGWASPATSRCGDTGAHALLDARLLIAFHRLRRALAVAGAEGEYPTAAVEGDALTLLRDVCDAYGRRCMALGGCAAKRHQLACRRHGEIVELVKCMLARAPEDVHALDDLSAYCGVSTSQLAHVFPRETGLSPHRYLLQLRAARAVGELSTGAGDLSRLALELGFATHSHFTAAFRRCMGVTPSEAKAAVRTRSSTECRHSLSGL